MSQNTVQRKYIKYTPNQLKKRTYFSYILFSISNLLFIFGIGVLIYFLVLPSFTNYFYKSSSKLFVKPFEGSVLSYTYSSEDNGFYFKELEDASWKYSNVSRNISEDAFYLTVPKLNISNAEVIIDSPTLDPKDHLGHYKGTSLPGEVGNTFIYGHSSLPIFYDPKDYKSIFSKIPSLEKNDKILVEFGNTEYVYNVVIKKELLPSEVNPFTNYYPSLYHKSTITLMTCTPPGTQKYRYLVLAELVSEEIKQ